MGAGSQTQLGGNREWENAFIRLTCRQPCGLFSWLMIGVAGPNPLWALLPLDWWSWAVWDLMLNKPVSHTLSWFSFSSFSDFPSYRLTICKMKRTFLSLSWFWRVYFHSIGNLGRTVYDSYLNNRKPKQTTITMLEGTQCHGWEVNRGYIRDKVERSGEMILVSNEGGKWCGCPGIVITVTEARGSGESGDQIASVRTVVEPTQGRRCMWTM